MLTRRAFLRKSGAIAALLGGSAGVYGVVEAHDCVVTRQRIVVPRLPTEFNGLTIAFLSDLHHSAIVSQHYLRGVIAQASALHADLILLGGDYITRGNQSYVAPCFAMLRELHAPLGVFGVLGNHDPKDNFKQPVKDAMRTAGIIELTNTGVWLTRGPARLRLCGVGDFITDHQYLDEALGDSTPADAALLLTHNPDFMETVRDPRVALAFCGHTHGGQVRLPLLGAPFPHSIYGAKYVMGLCHAPTTQVFITRGVGTIGLPVRIDCPPEIALLTLARSR